jgi:hypothetical protein
VSEKVVLVYDNNMLVSAKKLSSAEEEPDKLTSLVSAARSAHKQQFWHYESLCKEIAGLQKRLKSLEKLVEIRTEERDGAKDAHKVRVMQVNHLKDHNYELRGRIQILEEEVFGDTEVDEDDLIISMKVDSDRKPHAVAAKAIKKD